MATKSIEGVTTFRLWDNDEWPKRYGSWRDGSKPTHGTIDRCTGSDYNGSLIERSNRDVFREEFADGEEQWWTEVSGGHGTFAIVVKLDAIPEECREWIASLDNYCSASDDHLSELEMAAQSEAWENWARSDFRKALEKRIGDDADLSSVEGEALFEVFQAACDKSNTYWKNEQGDSMHIDIARIVSRGVTEEQIAQLTALVDTAE